ncbi:musculin [Chrysemys picta bellii]|uniref:musculin n=1 Tax=Chrysemys picta bellii TaxID=8478 RepID=UPI0032B1ACB5
MSTGSASDAEELPAMELRGLQLGYPPSAAQRQPRGPLYPSADQSSAAEEEDEEEEEEDGEGRCAAEGPTGGCKRKRARASGKKQPPLLPRGASGECKQSQRNAANARERARMRVLSKAFSRLKTSLPWVPPDTKLSKLDTLRLASSYIAHLRQLLQEDRYENGYVHPVNLTWPFVVSGRPESDTKEVSTANRLCGTTA